MNVVHKLEVWVTFQINTNYFHKGIVNCQLKILSITLSLTAIGQMGWEPVDYGSTKIGP